MRDPRFDRLAEILTGYSTELKRNEKVLIEAFDAPDEMTIALVRAARKRGATPFVQLQRRRLAASLPFMSLNRSCVSWHATNWPG